MDSTTEIHADWISEILDIFTTRFSETSSTQNFESSAKLAQSLSRQTWAQIISSNLLASTTFQDIVMRLQDLAPRQILQNKEHRIRIEAGNISGRVLLRDTYRERILKNNPMLWVTKRSRKIWQTSINASIAGFFQSILRPLESSISECSPAVQRGYRIVSRLLGTEPLRHVEPNLNWRYCDRPSHLSAKSEFYRLCFTWMDSFEKSFDSRDAASFRTNLLNGWLASEKEERLLELYALSKSLKALAKARNWDDLRIISGASVTGSTEILATSERFSAKISFDRSPPIQGHYRWILNRYSNIDGRGRRPDLTISTTRGNRTLTTLVEVKATEPMTTYGRDSIVKVMGYLQDFRELWNSENSVNYSRAILLYRGAVGAKVSSNLRASSDEIFLSDPSSFGLDVYEIIRCQLKHHETMSNDPDSFGAISGFIA